MKKESGFTLIELLFVIGLITMLSAIVFSGGFFNTAQSHGGEQLINDLSTRLYEKRSEALRLNGSKSATSFQAVAPPIEFDLLSSETTASLKADGMDVNADGTDDDTGEPLTFLQPNRSDPNAAGAWRFVRRDDQIRLPSDWKLAATAADLGSVPVIASGARGRGIPVTRIAFDGEGRALYRNAAGVWEKTPSGTASGKKSNESAFWALYFIRPGSPVAAVAVGVYPASGIVERFRWDGTAWRGFADRTPTNK